MRSHIDRETVHAALHWHVGQLAEMVRVVLFWKTEIAPLEQAT
jgi:hypothetical protein